MSRGTPEEQPRQKYLVMTITYIVEPNLINMEEILDKLRESGAAGVSDTAVEELTTSEIHERTRD